jgi:hypothetical protein
VHLGRMSERMRVVPITLKEANAFVTRMHRHHGKVVGHLFSVAVALGDAIVGVAIVGRPVARMLQDGYTAEVTRCCTDGTEHAASKLYGACWRVAQQLGYRRLLTYVLNTEPGTTLRAAGWKCYGEAGGGSWSREGRPRVDLHPTQTKIRWEAA